MRSSAGAADGLAAFCFGLAVTVPPLILPFSTLFSSAAAQSSSLTLHTTANSVQNSQLSPRSEGPGPGR